jgi:hypothetical protein
VRGAEDDTVNDEDDGAEKEGAADAVKDEGDNTIAVAAGRGIGAAGDTGALVAVDDPIEIGGTGFAVTGEAAAGVGVLAAFALLRESKLAHGSTVIAGDNGTFGDDATTDDN